MTYRIEMRCWQLVNTDPQRRCYDGCHFSAEWRQSSWEVLETGIQDIDARMQFWKELNDYAVSQRGPSAQCEYRFFEELDEKVDERS